MSKYTPGPWRWMANDGNPDALMVVAGAIGECGICRIINRPAGTKQQPTSEHPHNARLLAAAPELLEALSALTEWGCTHTSPLDPNSPHELLIAARAAIAKAEGTDR